MKSHPSSAMPLHSDAPIGGTPIQSDAGPPLSGQRPHPHSDDSSQGPCQAAPRSPRFAWRRAARHLQLRLARLAADWPARLCEHTCCQQLTLQLYHLSPNPFPLFMPLTLVLVAALGPARPCENNACWNTPPRCATSAVTSTRCPCIRVPVPTLSRFIGPTRKRDCNSILCHAEASLQ